MAEQCLDIIGVSSSALAVGCHYGARDNGGVLDAWLVDLSDAAALEPLTHAGINCAAEPLWMSDEITTAQLASQALALALRPAVQAL